MDHCQPIVVNRSFEPFRVYEREPDCVVAFESRTDINFFEGNALFSNVAFTVHQSGEKYVRQYIEYKEEKRPYAISEMDMDAYDERVCFLPEFAYAFTESQNSFSHIGLEELLMRMNRMILHASFVETPYGGILFSGPSKVGKSTQAELWHDYEHSEIINGDRPILGKENGVWRAWGSPYAGSSIYHIAKSLPIRGIVVLKQSEENQIRRLSVSDAFRKLFSEITINTWNPLYVRCVADMAADLSASAAVYELACTPDERAVRTLEKVLKQEMGKWI